MIFSTSLLLLNNIKTLDSFNNLDNVSRTIENNAYIIAYISLLLFFTALPAVLVSVNCNKDNKILYGFIAFIFSDLYLLQWSIKKFIIKDPEYCKLF